MSTPKRQTKLTDYEAFEDKFKAKKTTDDCYTPTEVYEVVKTWAINEYGLEGREIVRPFWPGGEYTMHEYPPKCIVIDNPPFSIMSDICRWYAHNGIDYFMFAPHLTLFGIPSKHINVGATIVYANGASVSTSFVTNIDRWQIRTSPELYRLIKAAQKDESTPVRRLGFSPNIINSARLGWASREGFDLRIPPNRCLKVRKAGPSGVGIFGGGYIIPDEVAEHIAAERAAAERAAAERAAAERAAAEKEEEHIPLTAQEIEVIDRLNSSAA